jgi:hypothetical protein
VQGVGWLITLPSHSKTPATQGPEVPGVVPQPTSPSRQFGLAVAWALGAACRLVTWSSAGSKSATVAAGEA